MKKIKKKITLFFTSLLFMMAFPCIVSAATTFPTDVVSPSSGNMMAGFPGTFSMDSEAVINRINEIRLEACLEGVKNPRTGQPLTRKDYVPIKWSSDLEYIAKIRAAESIITMNHVRSNGTSCFAINSPSGVQSFGEVLAWCWGSDVVYPVEMWYREKASWVNSTGGVTGHYTAMINPGNKYFGMGYFNPDESGLWNCGAGEFSGYGTHAQAVSKMTESGSQLLELLNGYVTGVSSLTGKTSGAINETNPLSAAVSTDNVERLSVIESTGWSSSDANVATVDARGNVTGHNCGTATITLSVHGYASSVKYTVDHTYGSWETVTPAGCTTPGLQVRRCLSCGKTEESPISATGHLHTVVTNAAAATCTEAGYTGDIYCEDCHSNIKGEVIPEKGHSFGDWTTTRQATVLTDGQQERVCSQCGAVEYHNTEKLQAKGTLNSSNFALKVKQTATLTVSEMAAGDYVVSWTSSNTKYATVDKNGRVTGKKKGTAKITATLASGKKLTATVKVQTGKVKTSSITVNTKNVTLKTGATYQLVSSRAPFTSAYGISYSTKNSKIASVSKAGKITAKKPGTTYIYVKSGSKKVIVKVKVEGVKTTKLTANATKKTVNRGKSFSWKVIKSPTNSTEGITYSTSNKRVATVNSSGKITGKKKGIVTITAKSGSQKISIRISVR